MRGKINEDHHVAPVAVSSYNKVNLALFYREIVLLVLQEHAGCKLKLLER